MSGVPLYDGVGRARGVAWRGVAFLPAYARNFLPWSVISRPLKGDAPTIDLVIGYHRSNASRTLQLFLSRLDELIARVAKK